MKNVLAIILGGGRGTRLYPLTKFRAKPAVPIGGKFRLIDFTLSNCVNSEISDIAVLAQYAPLSLAQHLGRGEPWDLNRRDGGVQILQPYARQEGARWYEGTADALRQNLDVIENSGAERVFLLSSDLIYKMDYSWMTHEHWDSAQFIVMEYAYWGRMDIHPDHVTHPQQLTQKQLTGGRIIVADACFRLSGTNGYLYNHGQRGASVHRNPELFNWGHMDVGPPALTGLNRCFGDGHVEWKSRAEYDVDLMNDWNDRTEPRVLSGNQSFY